jgi:cytochrome c biogenesis protein ResB
MPKKQFYWNWVFLRQVQAPNALFEAAPCTANLSGVTPSAWLAGAAQQLRQRRYHIRTSAAGGVTYLLAERSRFSALAVVTAHASLILLLLGIALSALFSWREPLSLGPSLPAKIQHLDGATLSYSSYTFSLLPSGRSDIYGVKVTVSSPGQADFQAGIDVNKPLLYKNARIYLLGPGPGDNVKELSLLALYDPGLYLIFAAGFLMLAGLIVSFSFPYRAIRARLTPTGQVVLAGWPANASRELLSIFEELKQYTPENTGEASRHVD